MRAIQETITQMYRHNISDAVAVKKLMSKCSNDDLAVFIIDAFNRGWISLLNLGLDEERKVI